MNTLTIHQPTAVQLRNGRKCSDMSDAELNNLINSQVKLACYYLGKTMPEDPQLFLQIVSQRLRQINCSEDEFKKACEVGMTTATTYATSAPATYIEWVQAYMDRVRAEIVAYKQKVLVETYKPERMNEQELLTANVTHVMELYGKCKQGQPFFDGGSAAFLWLESIGEIEVSIDEKAEMFEQSRERAIAALHAKRQEVDRYESRAIKHLLEDIEARAKDVPELRFEQVKICRNDLLKQYFMANELTADYLMAKAKGVKF